jgi:hypothetical protein
LLLLVLHYLRWSLDDEYWIKFENGDIVSDGILTTDEGYAVFVSEFSYHVVDNRELESRVFSSNR